MIASGPPKMAPRIVPSYLDRLRLAQIPTPPSLEDELKRLVRDHGRVAVAKAAKKATKPNKRQDLERQDMQALAPLIREEAERELAGLPKRSNPALAKAVLPSVQQHSEEAAHRRIMRRLASHHRKWLQGLYLMEAARVGYPADVLYVQAQRFMELAPINLVATTYVEFIEGFYRDLETAGLTAPQNATYEQLMTMAHEAIMNLPPPKRPGLLDPLWKRDTK